MLSKLHLINFKAFADQQLDLRPLTLLTGLNGMGKSSVLQSLLMLRQSYFGATSLDAYRTRRLVLNGDLTQLGSPSDILFEGAANEQIGMALTFDDHSDMQHSVQWTFEYDQSQAILIETSNPELIRIGGQTRLFFNDCSLFKAGFHYLQAERVGPRTAFDMNFATESERFIGTRGEYAVHLLNILQDTVLDMDELIHPAAASRKLLENVEAWMSEISPGTRLVLTPHRDMDVLQLSINFERGRAITANYRATNVGFGITYVLPVLVAILSSEPGDIVLVENPEAHLHPKGQYKMGELLALAAQAGIQVLVETHSDHVLNGIRVMAKQGRIAPDNVALHFFQAPHNDSIEVQPVEVVTPQLDADGRIDNWPANFFDEWENALDQLL